MSRAFESNKSNNLVKIWSNFYESFSSVKSENLQCAKASYGTDKKAQEDGETTPITNT